ncbi:mid region of cactin-domain-containing protein [Emericellopsis atlantica]|uniref:Splicing factor Cactin n=1 Tax=Emericellopsis atlantica TaxID=2614577 RepID=A0A9P7ZUW2_9HYPO|nr:mid region of cactin-domain-containing protein [Emericellopsis atlantica]KAG9258197.1 mid region of cactin-domain-containing protein [Emericellopsis atlantica]
MDPARRAMIEGRRSPNKRDATAARFDPSTRVTKTSRTENARPTKSNRGGYNGGGSAPQHMTEDEQSRKFVADEDKFVLKQSKTKADIRVREGRAKPIDYLAFSLKFIDPERDILDDEDQDLDIELPSPSEIVQDLTAAQLKELQSDIASYHVLETNAKNREYWQALQSLCDKQMAKLSPEKNEERVVSSVADDIDKILAPKTYEQLETLEGQIKAKLQSTDDIDTDYWEQLLRSLAVWKSKATLNKVFAAVTEARAERLKKRGAVLPSAPRTSGSTSTPANNPKEVDSGAVQAPTPKQDRAQAPPGTSRFSQSETGDFSQTTNALYDREVARGVEEGEEVFTAEEAVPTGAQPQWADKYRPRKPRYFNRVQMGYEWNKYNQTHYDQDNPPPKVVQGYKFNIFYPELIDKTKAPTFKIIREHGRRRGESFAAAGEEDTCLIRFIAGPPYEDIAFRIVDREWDYSAKRDRGFKSSFDKGILQLHFQFKKIFYRK